MKNLKHTIVARDKTTGIVRNFVFETVDDTIFVTENTVSSRSLDYAVKVKLLDRFYMKLISNPVKEERKRITGIIRQVGALENDEEVEKLINTINYKND